MGLRAGIDLGTTNSCIYVLVGDKWDVVRDKHDRPTIPSAVWKHKGNLKVGYPARACVGQFPGPILEVKRLMGTDSKVDLDGEKKSAVEVSAIILHFLRDAAEEFVKDRSSKITDVVITHPAYFSAAARAATAEAGKLAGFSNVTLLPEPIAAALAYASRARTGGGSVGDKRILAYDLGGGTFDVTVLERRASDNMIEVLDYGGDHWLGGANFDLRLAEYLRKKLVEVNNYALDSLDPANPEDAVRIQQLKTEAEAIKIQLTYRNPVEVAKPAFMRDKNNEPVDLNLTIGRAEFNEMTRDLMDKSMRLTHRTLAKQSFADGRRLSDEDLDRLTEEEIRTRSQANAQYCDIIMVGSSCLMPVVKERLVAELKKESQLVSPDVIVAEGAAIKVAASEADSVAIPTRDRRITLFLSCPPVTARALRFPISGELQGDASGCMVVLADTETGKEESRRLDKKLKFLFQRDLQKEKTNEFNLRVHNPAGEAILEDHPIRIRHDPNHDRDVVQETLSIPILVQTRTGFETLFAVNTALPVKGQITLLTPNDSGMLRVPFYEGDTYLDEIKIENAPKRKGVQFNVKAEMDKKYKVTAEAVLSEDCAKPPSVQFEIKPRKLRTIDEIQEWLETLQRKFDGRIVDVKDPDRSFTFQSRRRELEQEIERELQSIRPEPGHLEDLVAKFLKLVEEVGMLPRLTPDLNDLKAELEPRRQYAPNPGDVNLLNQILCGAEKAWEAQDEESWNLSVKQARELTRDWTHRDQNIQGNHKPPPPSQVRQEDLQFLDWMIEKVKDWPENAAEAREGLMVEIEGTKDKIRKAPDGAIYSLHNLEVLPLNRRVEAGPPAPSKKNDPYERPDPVGKSGR